VKVTKNGETKTKNMKINAIGQITGQTQKVQEKEFANGLSQIQAR
jgi:hypothetical protein